MEFPHGKTCLNSYYFAYSNYAACIYGHVT